MSTARSAKISMSTDWLSVCGGCHVAIVDLHEKLLDVLGQVDLLRCPVLNDCKTYPEARIGLVSGAVRTERDSRAATRMRETCDLVMAFGTCAVYGGLPGAALAHSPEEILDCVYRKSRTTRTSALPCQDVAPMETRVRPLDEVIDVDLYLPGCPPHRAFIFDGLLSLLESRVHKAKQETVCGRCERTMRRTEVDTIRPPHHGMADEEVCLLSQGLICLGSVTLDRCLSPCPRNGAVCTGCCGPTMQILTEPNRDVRTEIAERMAFLTRIPKSTVIEEIERSAKTFFGYSMAASMINTKPTFLLERWIAEGEARL